ncbi:hypothetical protein V6N12_028148 [Hibiscus sabdariffa]|uniref:Uncharacterized protein n=1 Tax=Hibiscus sabdariffa TaxID=183260 RepID=A0ABR2F518_9ROSI
MSYFEMQGLFEKVKQLGGLFEESFCATVKRCQENHLKKLLNYWLDPNGDEVLTGVRYYVVSANWGLGGEGLDIGRESDRRCPGNRRSESINDDKRLCRTSTVWKVQDQGESSRKRWVELGGSEGEPGGIRFANCNFMVLSSMPSSMATMDLFPQS